MVICFGVRVTSGETEATGATGLARCPTFLPFLEGMFISQQICFERNLSLLTNGPKLIVPFFRVSQVMVVIVIHYVCKGKRVRERD